MFNEFTYFLQQDTDIFILKRKVNPRNSGRHEVHVVMDVQLAAHCMLGQHPVTLPVHVHLLCMGGRADGSARTLAPPLHLLQTCSSPVLVKALLEQPPYGFP